MTTTFLNIYSNANYSVNRGYCAITEEEQDRTEDRMIDLVTEELRRGTHISDHVACCGMVDGYYEAMVGEKFEVFDFAHNCAAWIVRQWIHAPK